jgi:hypothetical protein
VTNIGKLAVESCHIYGQKIAQTGHGSNGRRKTSRYHTTDIARPGIPVS